MLAAPTLWCISAAVLSQGALVFTSPPQAVNLGAMSSALVVERRSGDGGVLSTGEPAITVALTSSTATGLFALAPDPMQPWASTCTTSIAAGSAVSAPCYFRDGTPGVTTVTATTASLGPGSQTVTVRPQSFDDGVESGTLFTWDMPAGQWNSFASPVTQNSVAVSAAAAHTGGFGIRTIDAKSNGPPSGQNHVAWDMASIPGSYYFRTWFRITSSNATGTLVPIQLTRTRPSLAALVDITLSYPGPTIQVAGFDSAMAYPTDDSGVTLAPGWHLVEVALVNMDTVTGGRTVWVDGTQIATRTVDWRGLTLGLFAIGEPWSGATTAFTGTLDFDAVRGSGQPLASRVVPRVGSGPFFPGSCVRVSVSLVDTSTGAPAAAPTDVVTTLGVSSVGGSGFADPGCSTPAANVTVNSGATSATTYFRPSSTGSGSLTATSMDFLPATTPFVVTSGAPLTVAPLTTNSPALGNVALTASGGLAPYSFSMLSAPSGGTVSPAGVYTAGTVTGVEDVVLVADTAGTTAVARVSVDAPDAGTGTDAGSTDAGADAGDTDAGAGDAGDGDAGTNDGGASDDSGVSDDGGTRDAGESSVARRSLTVGCGCVEAPAGVWPALFLLVIAARRRR